MRRGCLPPPAAGRGRGRARRAGRLQSMAGRGAACMAAAAATGGNRRRSGAPRGNRNAWKDGYWAAAARTRRRQMTAFIRDMEASVAEMERALRPPGRAAGGGSSGAWGCFPFFLTDAPPPASRASPVPPAAAGRRAGSRTGGGGGAFNGPG